MILQKIHDKVESGIAVFILGVGAMFCVMSIMLIFGAILLGIYGFFGGKL